MSTQTQRMRRARAATTVNQLGFTWPEADTPEAVTCPRCKREAHGWPVRRADVCSPRDWAHCIRQPEVIESSTERNDVDPATNTTSPPEPSIPPDMPVTQAKHAAAGTDTGDGMDTTEQAAPPAAADRAASRMDAARERAGIRVEAARERIAAEAETPGAEIATREVPGSTSAVATREGGTPQARSCQPADGVHALTLLSRFHQHYDYWAAPEYADLIAPWELQTHALEDVGWPIWRAVPRLIVAGMHGTGKDGTMAQIAAACGTNVLMKVTYPGIRDAIGLDKETVILNEAQMTFGAGRKSEDVRVVINAHVKGNMIRDGKHGKLNVFGQAAMAGLPKLLTGKVSHEIEDTLSRCFVAWKERKPKDHHVPEVTEAAEAQVREKMVPAMREWCYTYRGMLKARAEWFGEGNPTGLPDLGGGGRANDQLARPLLAVCDVATALAHEAWRKAGNGEPFPAEHNWAERIRKALIFVSNVPDPVEDEESPLDGVESAFSQMWAEDNGDASPAAGGVDILADLNTEGELA